MTKKNMIQSYLSSNYKIDLNQLLQIQHENVIYRFEIERLVYRKFEENEYLHFIKRKMLTTHSYRLIYYRKSGNAVWIDKKLVQCPEGTLLLLSPGEQPSNTPNIKGAYEIIVFVFDYKSIEGKYLTIPFSALLLYYINAAELDLETFSVLPLSHQQQLLTILDNIFLAIQNFPKTFQSTNPAYTTSFNMAGTVLQLFDFISSMNRKNIDIIPTPIKEAIFYIESNYQQQLSIEDLTRIASISKTHFQHLFKKYTQTTPIQFQQNIRLNNARLLLSETNRSCREIAEEIGYSNQYYFSKLFKEKTGMSPLTFRKQSRNI
ncbi:helix-turn-helix transcriptional regulator [Vallitalea okinawensis]|uniref:helix-turn-helix transcriptional regulator n=1 Tax=Vallitalea okinawensis TaxID=2078660 RepID=UPI000CFE1B87|nr:AraC family transcriptional regulator [Vallitalea okinawensis]